MLFTFLHFLYIHNAILVNKDDDVATNQRFNIYIKSLFHKRTIKLFFRNIRKLFIPPLLVTECRVPVLHSVPTHTLFGKEIKIKRV